MPKRVVHRLIRFSKWVARYLKKERQKVRELKVRNEFLHSQDARKTARIHYLEALLAGAESRIKLLSEEAELHPLTSLLNKRGLERKFLEYSKILGRALNKPAEISVVFMDLDGFKQVNDQHGHDAGDRMLCSIAEVLTSVFSRLTDIKGHIGGDEFVAILPNTSPQAASELASQVYIRLHESANADIQEFLRTGGGISIGIAAIPTLRDLGPERLLAEALKAADAAMYAAKENGKGRISLAA